jgi:hypothetical protein
MLDWLHDMSFLEVRFMIEVSYGAFTGSERT